MLIAARVYEYYYPDSGKDAEDGTGQTINRYRSYNWDQIVINDTVIFRDNYHIRSKDGFIIFLLMLKGSNMPCCHMQEVTPILRSKL